MIILELGVEIEHAGLTLSNHHQSIFVVAHLYNALQQTKRLKTRWPEMDRVIEAHMKTFFAGKLPENETDICSRCVLQLGFSTRQITRNLRERRSPFQQAFRQGMQNGPQMANTKMSEIFRQYFQKKTTTDQYLYQLEALIEETFALKTKLKTRLRQRQLTPLQLLTHIQSYFPTVASTIQIDYIELVRTCTTLLRQIKAKITGILGIDYPMGLGDGDSNEPGFIIMVMDILSEAAHMRETQEEILKIKQRDELIMGPQLEVTGMVMAKFIEKLTDGGASKGLADISPS
jgi:hypothetical protein